MKGILPREKFLEFCLSLGNDRDTERFNGEIGPRQTLERIERKFGTIQCQFVDTDNGIVILFTADEVIVVRDYDGEESLSRAPRNPETLLRSDYHIKKTEDENLFAYGDDD